MMYLEVGCEKHALFGARCRCLFFARHQTPCLLVDRFSKFGLPRRRALYGGPSHGAAPSSKNGVVAAARLTRRARHSQPRRRPFLARRQSASSKARRLAERRQRCSGVPLPPGLRPAPSSERVIELRAWISLLRGGPLLLQSAAAVLHSRRTQREQVSRSCEGSTCTISASTPCQEGGVKGTEPDGRDHCRDSRSTLRRCLRCLCEPRFPVPSRPRRHMKPSPSAERRARTPKGQARCCCSTNRCRWLNVTRDR